MNNEQLRATLTLLASQQKKLLEKPKRDVWDKLSIFAPLLTGLVITVTSIYITTKIQGGQKEAADRKEAAEKATASLEKKFQNDMAAREAAYQQRLAKTELLSKFLPYLAGKEEEASMAMMAIGATEDSDLIEIVGKMVPNPGVQKGLNLVARNGPTEKVRNAASKTLNVLEAMDFISSSSGGSPYGRRALAIAMDAVKSGVKEDPSRENRGKVVDEYNIAMRVTVGSPWCASFVSYCYQKALSDDQKAPFVLSALVARIESSLRESGLWRPVDSDYRPKPGDIVIYDSPTAAAHHLGIVIKADSVNVYAIEGNIGATDDASDATAVMGKERPLSMVRGFGEIRAQ
jgi:hypothetical protein